MPRLCVGLKAFHFGAQVLARERGTLLAHMHSIPPNNVVLVVAGEIDCRHNGQIFHSPVFAARKRHYPTTTQGIVATVKMYVEGLLAFAAGSSAPKQLLVMPVRPPPPLDPSLEYRGIIPIWNALLRRELRRAGAHVTRRSSSSSIGNSKSSSGSSSKKKRGGEGKNAAAAGLIFYVDLYAPLCAAEGEARAYVPLMCFCVVRC